MPVGDVNEVMDLLETEADPHVRSELADRYGIHTDRAYGIPMRRLKAIAKPLAADHHLALTLWSTGIYEARTVAAFVEEPGKVDVAQMDDWCADFDNWAIVDTVCFNLFDKAKHAWTRVELWADHPAEFTKRAGFALLWALALHDNDATDEQFRTALGLVERHACDSRHLVTKAQTMAMRAIGQKRPSVRPDVLDLADRLAASSDANARRVGRPIVTAFR